ncbi:MAG: NADH-quinone oxidoreductase subunit NuoK [Elusimicrobiota bacterium]
MSPILYALSCGLFVLGTAFLVLRRQLVAMVIGLELMINAANVLIVSTALAQGDPEGLAVALLVIAAAAAEAVVGLSLILALSREGVEPETSELETLQG